MSKATIIIVSENTEAIDKAKKYWEGDNVTVQVYSPVQWKEGIENPFFRSQVSSGVQTLMGGGHTHRQQHVNISASDETNVVQFPVSAQKASVQKITQLEAQAIENAIAQYKGNLTEAAKALGIGRATLYRKVKQYSINLNQSRKGRFAA